MPKRTTSDKGLRDKAFNTAEPPKYDAYERELASMVYNFFDKIFLGGAGTHAEKSAIKSKLCLTNN